MKLRFDFTKTDNTVMQSNVVDIPTGGSEVNSVSDITLLNLNDYNCFIIISTAFDLQFGAITVVSGAVQAIVLTRQSGSTTYAYVSYVKNTDKLTYFTVAPPGNAMTILPQQSSVVTYIGIK